MERDNCLMFHIKDNGVIYFSGGARGQSLKLAEPDHINGKPIGQFLHRECAGAFYKHLSKAFACREWVSFFYKLSSQLDPQGLSRRVRIIPVTQCDALMFEYIQ